MSEEELERMLEIILNNKEKKMNKCINCSRFLSCDYAEENIEECEMFINNINHIPNIT